DVSLFRWYQQHSRVPFRESFLSSLNHVADARRACRPDDRIVGNFAAVRKSAFGTKRTRRAVCGLYPIGSGFIASLARPGGNLTGLMLFEASVAGKWLAMLKEIAPGLSRAAVIHNPKITVFYLRAVEALAPSLAIEPVPLAVENAADIERNIELF